MYKEDVTKIYQQDGKKWIIPVVLLFGKGLKRWNAQYKILGYQSPKKGQFYLSGATVEVYEAYGDLTDKFLVVEPTTEMRRVSAWVGK
tara:strand:- start:785 stop:1048 length:264 start_codon:yes stop_codon:yes gene_type:complete